MKPPLAYRIIRYQGDFYPLYQRKSWLAFLGRGPVWCSYGTTRFPTEEVATSFIAKERDAWARQKLPCTIIRDISA